jgi:antitoxin component of RelBE/YafQ-DinJ toxin-antitoxin module
MSRLRDVFDNQKFYNEAFRESYRHADARRIVLAYKVHLVLNSPMEELDEKSPAKLKYAVSKARNLVWALLIQSLLNDSKVKDYLEWYGLGLQKENDFRMLLRKFASSKVLPILKRVLNDPTYEKKIASEKYSFLRTKELFRRSMDEAFELHGWTRKSL